MNETTWIISPNWIAWTLLGVATSSLVAIAIRLWVQRRAVQTTTNQAALNRGEVVAWIAVVLALISGVCVFFKTPDPNNASMLITALGVMVTLLVAWQIWQTISADRKIKEIEAKVIGNEAFINARVCYTQGIFLATWSAESTDKDVLKNLCVAYRNFLESFFYDLQSSKDIKRLNGCLDGMEKCLNKLQKENIEFTKTVGKKCDTLFENLLLMQLLTSPKLHERLTCLNEKRTGKHSPR